MMIDLNFLYTFATNNNEEKEVREDYYLNGKYYDKILMDILKSEFHETYIRNKYIK